MKRYPVAEWDNTAYGLMTSSGFASFGGMVVPKRLKSLTTTNESAAVIGRDALDLLDFEDVASGPGLPPLRPGEVLLEEFMRPAGLTARALAAELGVPGNRVSAIINGSRGITAETALLLARRFGTSAEVWMNLQTAHDLAVAREALGELAVA